MGYGHGMALDKEQKQRLPSTLKRSPSKAQETYVHTLEAAEETHGDGEAAHRIAFASLKYSFEKVGDHWEPKDERGPSDDQDAQAGGRGAPVSDRDGRRSERPRVEDASEGGRRPARHTAPYADDQGRAGRRHPAGEPTGVDEHPRGRPGACGPVAARVGHPELRPGSCVTGLARDRRRCGRCLIPTHLRAWL